MPRTNAAAYAALVAVALVVVQFGALHTVTSGLAARIILPATVASIPLALWAHRRRVGVWIVFVGIAANLASLLANGGLMPIARETIVDAVGQEQATKYTPGDWIRGSKDVLLAPGEGHLRALGDGIVVRIGAGGFVASPGDLVVWAGLVVFAAEVAASRQGRGEPSPRPIAAGAPTRAEQAEGGSAT